MQHTTFITVAEFKANGGSLKDNHKLYYTDGTRYRNIGWFDANNQDSVEDGWTIITNPFRKWQMTDELLYVSVPCTIIYE